PGSRVILIHEDGLRAFGFRVPVTGEINKVELIAEDEGMDVLLRDFVLEARDGLFVPIQRQAIVLGGLGRSRCTGSGTQQQLLAVSSGARLDDFAERLLAALRLQTINLIEPRKEATSE